jgi:hypothetical protein
MKEQINKEERKVNLTLAIPIELRRKMQEHDEVNWSAVIRKLLQQHMERVEIAERIAQKSRLNERDAREISELIDKEVAKKLKLR